MSGEIQESIDNFKVISVFNRRDYFSNKFNDVNLENYKASMNSMRAEGAAMDSVSLPQGESVIKSNVTITYSLE